VQAAHATTEDSRLDDALAAVLSKAGFTGNIQRMFEQRLEANLGRSVDPELANLGRLLWFDKIHSLHRDNTWASGIHRAYRQLLGEVFPEMAAGAPIDFCMFGKAIAEFEFTQVFANAPIDRFARGERSAMTPAAKRGTLLFFGKAGCVQCHAVSGRYSVGEANEMFTDFEERVIGVPQIAPFFGTLPTQNRPPSATNAVL